MLEKPLRIGLFGIGLDSYWPQFKGLEARLTGYLNRVAAKLRRPGVRVVNLGLVDTPEKAVDAGHRFRRADVDLLFLHVTTYALSSTLLSVVQTVDGRLKLLMAEAESVASPILEIGNTNSRYRFGIGTRKFVETWNAHGPAHHCAVGVGHVGSKIEKLGKLLGMEVVRVC